LKKVRDYVKQTLWRYLEGRIKAEKHSDKEYLTRRRKDKTAIQCAAKNAATWKLLYLRNNFIFAYPGGDNGSITVRAAWLRRWPIDDRVWVQIPVWPDHCISTTYYSGVCFEIKISGRHRGFDGVLFNLWPLADTGFRDAQ